MKVVYIDVILAVNFCIDYILLYLVASFLHIKVKILRYTSASLLGSMFAVFAGVLPIPNWARVLLTLCVLPVICFAAFGKRCLRTYVKIVTLFFAFSIMLGGTILLFAPYIRLNFVVLLVLICSFSFFVKRTSEILKTDIISHKVRIKVVSEKVKTECIVLCDSGNTLRDPYNGYPVILLEANFKEILLDGENSVENCSHIRLIPIVSVSGTSLIKAFTPERVYVCTEKEKMVCATIGFVEENMKLPEGCSGIIPSIFVDNL